MYYVMHASKTTKCGMTCGIINLTQKVTLYFTQTSRFCYRRENEDNTKTGLIEIAYERVS
jgi:hypothetical protein